MKYKYITTEKSRDVRHFKILSDRKLDENEIEDILALPDIDKKGDTEKFEGGEITYVYTEYGDDDSQINYYLESFANTIKLIKGGKD